MSSRKNTNESASSSRSNRNTSSELNSSDDKLFEPSLEMMVNDFDDESTLELEEKMASTEAQDPNAELNSLQKEGDMPIEELLALYNCVPPTIQTFSSSSGGKRRSKTSRNAGIDKTLMPPPDTPKTSTDTSSSEKAKDEQSEGAAIAETETHTKTETEKETETTTELQPDTKPESNIELETQTKTKPSTDATVNEEKESNEENPSDESKHENDEEINTSKVDKVQPPESEIEEETKGVSTETNSSDKENSSKHENESNGSDHKESTDTVAHETKDDDKDKKSQTDSIIKNEEHSKKANDAETIEETVDEDDDESEEEESELKKLYPETYKPNEPRLLRANSQPNSDDEEEEDIDYSPEEDEFKKKIMVGSEYQAQIPEGLCRYDDALPYENEDKLVWDPSQLQECDIESYLQKASIPVIVGSPSSNSPASPTSQSLQPKPLTLPNGLHLRDDEGSLFLLLQCGHNTEEALRRRRLNATIPQTAVAVAATASNQSPSIENTLWSEEECRNFESGLRVYGKDFHAIQQSKVRTRSVSELVQFYYLWKKTERHDIFANKARLEKKKYNLHPGLTDYMDRFLEEQENNGGISISNSSNNIITGVSHGNNNGNERTSRDRSMSPVINSLLYTDCKRQRMSE
ncbi:mesoderm induction early response protein 1 isoform X2 [Sitodiplosis mosellana]|uniref:mesoderm induction early response protein 1 isoform X2 n=1 Tax=Sitodiplosis mosellana TaxID=263140 RepID=UPI0024451CD7|nr:mesoderm induction early response protein 1 isoform X2 [Sitodiplosis mosellana]